MSNVLVDASYLTAIGNAIRNKNGSTVKYKPSEMADAINSLNLSSGDSSESPVVNDAWKYSIDSNLENQSIDVKVNADLIGDNTTGYKSKLTFSPTIKSNFGYIAGSIKKTTNSTNHIINFSANPATETDKLVKDGWTPVYVIGNGTEYNNSYYTTTTPDDTSSFKSISSSDNIENILICGYYTKDSSTGKLSSTDFDSAYLGNYLASAYTKKIKNTYATSIGSNAFSDCRSLTSIDLSNVTSIGSYAFSDCRSLTSIDLSNVTSIGRNAFSDCRSLTSIDLSNVTSIGRNAFYNCSLTIIDLSNATSIDSDTYITVRYIIIDSNIVSTAHDNLMPFTKVLIPQSMMDAYVADKFWSKHKPQLDAIENYTITRENGQITVTKK